MQPSIRCASGIVFLSWVVSSCSHPSHTPSPSESIQPGESDYPEINPQGSLMVTVTGVLPRSLPIALNLVHSANPRADAGAGTAACSRQLHSEEHPALILAEPLRIEREGDRFSASIPVDKYLPGRCDWRLEGLKYQLLNSGGAQTGGWLVVAYDRARDGADLTKLPRGRAVIWCVKNSDATEPERPELCANLAALKLVSSIPDALVGRLPQPDRDNHGVIWIFPDTHSVEIEFHDLDSQRKR